MLNQEMKSKVAACHPEKRVYARGLCQSCYNKWLRKNNPDLVIRQRENHDRWVKEHREYKKQLDKNWRMKQDPEYNHIRKLRKLYNMTPADYDFLLEKQGGVCAICGKEPTKKRKLHVDHDHQTGGIRGLLCFRCNFGLTYFSENHLILQNASNYLATSKERASIMQNRQMIKQNDENIKFNELQKTIMESHTKTMDVNDKLEIKKLSQQGVVLKELCCLFPKYSRSSIHRASRNKTVPFGVRDDTKD